MAAMACAAENKKMLSQPMISAASLIDLRSMFVTITCNDVCKSAWFGYIIAWTKGRSYRSCLRLELSPNPSVKLVRKVGLRYALVLRFYWSNQHNFSQSSFRKGCRCGAFPNESFLWIFPIFPSVFLTSSIFFSKKTKVLAAQILWGISLMSYSIFKTN